MAKADTTCWSQGAMSSNARLDLIANSNIVCMRLTFETSDEHRNISGLSSSLSSFSLFVWKYILLVVDLICVPSTASM